MKEAAYMIAVLFVADVGSCIETETWDRRKSCYGS